MPKDPFVYLYNQQMKQAHQLGVYKGEVVDVRDPNLSGRVRVHVYGLHGDYPRTDISMLPWIEPIHGSGFYPLQLGDRIAVTFEAGDKTKPIMLGRMTATPMGRGRLPWNTRIGNELPPQGWWNNDMYPESIVFGRGAHGSCGWLQEIFLSKGDSKDPFSKGTLSTSVVFEDTGGKAFRTISVHRDVPHWSPVNKFKIGLGGLYKGETLVNRHLRSGFEVGGFSEGSTTVGDSGSYMQMLSGSGPVVQMVAGNNAVTCASGSFSTGILSVGAAVAAQGALIAGQMHTPPKSW